MDTLGVSTVEQFEQLTIGMMFLDRQDPGIVARRDDGSWIHRFQIGSKEYTRSITAKDALVILDVIQSRERFSDALEQSLAAQAALIGAQNRVEDAIGKLSDESSGLLRILRP